MSSSGGDSGRGVFERGDFRVSLSCLSPEARYVFVFVPTVSPYVGAFYRHTFAAGEEDLDSLGGRADTFFPEIAIGATF